MHGHKKVFIVLIYISSIPIRAAPAAKSNAITAKGIYGHFFAKVPQEISVKPSLGHEMSARAFFPSVQSFCQGCTNQVAKVLHPMRSKTVDANDKWITGKNVNIPVVKQPFDKYKLVMVTAPNNVEFKDDPTVIYVILPDEIKNINRVPKIYFVNAKSGKLSQNVNRLEPVLLMNSSRTVTNIKSKELAKFIRFKNKFVTRSPIKS